MKKLFKKLFGFSSPELSADPTGADTPPINLGLPPTPEMRSQVIGFIIDKLKPFQNEGLAPLAGLEFFVLCDSNEEEALFNEALYVRKPEKFKEKLHLELVNYHIHLKEGWNFTSHVVRDKLPECKFHHKGRFGLNFITDLAEIGTHAIAKLTPTVGQMSQSYYHLKPKKNKSFYIGREKNPELNDHTIRTNQLYFLSKNDPKFIEQKGGANMSVSRNHARIDYDANNKKFYLLAEEGGTSLNGNKTKIFRRGQEIRIDVPGIRHELKNDDYIELGGKAKIWFQID